MNLLQPLGCTEITGSLSFQKVILLHPLGKNIIFDSYQTLNVHRRPYHFFALAMWIKPAVLLAMTTHCLLKEGVSATQFRVPCISRLRLDISVDGSVFVSRCSSSFLVLFVKSGKKVVFSQTSNYEVQRSPGLYPQKNG
jgi:hypothetical protein